MIFNVLKYFDILWYTTSKNMPSFHLLGTVIYGTQLDTRGQLNPLLYFPNVLQVKLIFFLEARNSKKNITPSE